jgi:hypothetical protein
MELFKSTEQVMPGSEGKRGERVGRGEERREWGGGQGEEMIQTMYAHVNK